MIHTMDDDSYLRHPSFAEQTQPSSRSSQPSSRTRVLPNAVMPTGLEVLTENVANLSPDRLGPTSPIQEGLGSLNRWSQSTASSKSPSEYTGHHRRGSSKMSVSGYNRGPAPGLPFDLPGKSSSFSSQHFHPTEPRTDIAHTSSIPNDEDPATIQHGLTQKAMLSKALQKANTAVLLDNAANFEGAMEAYTDACNLLQLVMLRSNGGDEEKFKLQEIRDTYMLRVTELHRMDFPLAQDDGKALPDRPLSQESYGELLHSDGQNSPIPQEFEAAHRHSLKPSPLEDQPSMTEENESTSWLDTIDESGSSPSSANSKASSVYLRRRTSRRLSDTEAEFDAALDAAVEAAYDEGLEPVLEYEENDDIVSNARRNIQLAKQRVREAEQEAEAMNMHHKLQDASMYSDDEEEERLLEEMTKGYVMDDFEFGIQSKSALPRESDSSNMSARTWESSTSNAAGLSPLAEDDVVDPRHTTPSSPPSSGLPPLPASSDFPIIHAKGTPASSIRSLASSTGPGVRARRLSSQTQLKIEINRSASVENLTLANRPPPLPKDELGARLYPRNPSIHSFTDISKTRTHEDETDLPPLPPSARPMGKVPSAPDGLNKHTKPFRARNASVPIQIPDRCPESPSTPWSGAFPDTRGVTVSPIPELSGNMFSNNIHSPTELGRPNSLVANGPAPLEPCPESFLLRPFWLMRCLYQTLAHPHGGYLSQKLFIPRDVWRVKNVKLKALEDKVSNCDLLTAALLKLAQVDTYDADAVLEEMQSFESVLDQVQGLLSKKLGSDVGVQASMPLFKPASMPDESAPPENKYLTWKRLRAKTSGLAANPARESHKDNLNLNSVPMTSLHGTPAKRNVTQLEFSGPNANYMGALARLFDAAQVLEQIAQQVEDPGLKHSSKTHVGLELSTRHAAEFFGFYICRFALADVGLMLDKFIKRGSEWVLV
ncbi:hypothetical protein N7457_003096 [Penicillium paradoxum]|uniref:uncharacterized protein n=1 Tax=Penicillium paradoxum TaxID=176176 RepID=UPI002548EFCB|nr:uncharacterized protein N7457_003096 [Penicillium paradoxum]KAJ5788106.1 hypothetical protein N7457_003096 [Penicillium paradoxum]